MAQEIENFVRKQNYKIQIEILYEDEILDTGGGIKNLIKNEVDENFLVINPDTIWSDKYLDEAVQMKNLFFKNNLDNILLLVKKTNSFDKRFIGDFDLNKNLISNKSKNYIFTGCQIVNKKVFNKLNKDKFSMNEIWNENIKNGQLYGYESLNEFLHVTDLEMYNMLNN